jgi:hypothetical protein
MPITDRRYISSLTFLTTTAIVADGSNYWTARVRRKDSSGTDQGSWSVTSAGGWAAYAQNTAAIGSWFNAGDTLVWDLTKTGTAVTLFGACLVVE